MKRFNLVLISLFTIGCVFSQSKLISEFSTKATIDDDDYYLIETASGTYYNVRGATLNGLLSANIWTESGSNVYVIGSSVGVGTSTPSSDFQVIGVVEGDTIKINDVYLTSNSDTLTINNFEINDNYLKASNGAGIRNISSLILPNILPNVSDFNTGIGVIGSDSLKLYGKVFTDSFLINNKTVNEIISDSLSNFTSDTVQYSFFADTANLAPLYLPLAGGTVTGDLTTQGATIVNKIQKEGSIYHEIVMEEDRQYNFRFTTIWEDRDEAGEPSDQIIINRKELLQYVSLPDEFSFDYFRLGRERESDASSGSVVDFYDDYILFRVIGKHDTVDKPIYKQEAIPDSGLVTRGTLNKYLPLTGGSLSGNLDVNGNISVDTIKEFKNYVAKFHRVDSVNTSNTSFNAVKWDTFVSDESVGNWTLTTDSTGIYPPVDGIYQFMGCIHAKNNGGTNVEAVICSYPYVGTDTARCGQTQWTFDKSDGEHDQKTFTGTIRMTTSTPFKLDVSVGDASVDFATNSCLPKHVAFSVSFIKISD